MKKEITNLSKSLLSKLALLAALFIGGGNSAWADTVIVDGSTIADGWTNGGATNFTASTGNVTSIAQEFLTSTAGQISCGNGYSWYSLSSTEAIGFAETQTVEIGVKAMNNYGGELIVRYSTDGSTYTNAADITTEIRSNDAMADFNTIVINSIPAGDVYLQIIGKAIYINSAIIKGDGPVVTTPKLSVSPTNIAFGSMRSVDSKTITVSNKGVGSMNVTISNDNTTDFTVSTTSLNSIGEGGEQSFDVTFNYNSESLGAKVANITVTPEYDASAAITIVVTATASSLNVWEDFTDGIPSTWYKDGNYWSASNGKARVSFSGFYLRTPCLNAEKDAEISFDVSIDQSQSYSTYFLQAEYSTDCVNWTVIGRYTSTTSGAYTDNITFAAPETGDYWLRFTGSHASIDNFSGWTVATPSLDMVIASSSIPAMGSVGGDYQAFVEVIERGGVSETVSVELYFGEEKVAEKTNYTMSGNSNATFDFTYALTEEWTGDVYIKVVGENLGAIETEKVAVTVSEPSIVLDEDGDNYVSTKPTCSGSVVKLKYTAKQGWNTIVLPFSPSSNYMTSIFGADYVAYAISKCEEGVLTFTKYTYLTSSTPYLVYAPNAVEQPDGIYLKNVSITSSSNWTSSNLNKSVSSNAATFKGTFAPIDAPGMEGKYGITSEGKLGKGGSGASIKGYRAYLEVSDEAAARGISIYTIDGDDVTAIDQLVQMTEGQADAAVYNLSGQRVEKAAKGLYIVNGKKIIVK